MLALAALAGPAAAAPSARDKAHIAAIENGLLPAVVIEGRPLPTRTLGERMRADRVPGVSIAFFENGHIEWVKAYGVADVASGRRVTPETLFQAASISKSLTATAALRLVQDGKLDLDQDVNTRLKGWKVPDSAFTARRKVTLRALLSHTAGLTVHGFPGYAPGAHWDYSGGGYVIVQLMMTEATGQAFPHLMRQLVLEPAGMTRSTFDHPLPPALKGEAATGYDPAGRPLPGGGRVFPELAPAGLWTTPTDLAHFAIAVQNANTGASHAILTQASARAMMTRRLGHWGLGVNLGPPGGPERFSHSGGNPGFVSDFVAFTGGSRQGVAIMTNGVDDDLVGDIVRAVSRSYGWPVMGPAEIDAVRLSAAQLAALVGVYEGADGDKVTVTVTASGGRLYAFVPEELDHEEAELAPRTPTEFVAVADDTEVEFTIGAGGKASKMAVDGASLTRITDAPL